MSVAFALAVYVVVACAAYAVGRADRATLRARRRTERTVVARFDSGRVVVRGVEVAIPPYVVAVDSRGSVFAERWEH
jgi:hypothetical protein